MNGCAFSGNSSELRTERRAIGALGSGFVDPEKPPAPEGMIRPRPGSWDAVHPPRDYRVVLLTAGDDVATTTLVAGVEHWAEAEHVRLEILATTEARAVDAIVEAVDLGPDLVLCAGNALVERSDDHTVEVVKTLEIGTLFALAGFQPPPSITVARATVKTTTVLLQWNP